MFKEASLKLGRSFAQVRSITCMRLRSHPFFFFFNQRSLFCSYFAICFVSLGMSPFDLLFKKKKKKRHPLLGRRQGDEGWLEDGARLLKEVISSCDGRGCYPIRMFSAKEIEQAIGQPFHSDRCFVAYEGTHEDRQIIIKVYREEQREMAFNEIATVTQIKHANVAKLLGCCFEMEQPILIYEKVPFILSNRLHQANPSSSLISWEHRLRIAIEIAYAVTYLHTANSRPIAHRGIKSSNILLDEHNKPKLFDFSLSITIPLGKTQVETKLAGTTGYIAPEHLNTGIVSDKSDVYSYGAVLLELLSGKRPRVGLLFDNDRLWHKFMNNESTEKEERLELILHNGLSMDVRQVEQAMACIEVAVGCISTNPDERPTMKEVTQQLEQIERGHSLLGRRQGEQGWLEDARLLKEVISSCDGRGCYPIRMFSAKEIEQAIGHFFHQDKWFYVAYEGTHEDCQIIIKVYKMGRFREMAFNEIATVTQINHANVAKLLGCCFEMEQPILIYEKVPFILRNRLRQANPSSSSPISWDHRLRIAIEIAYAITYLHTANSRSIVHRGIKSSNILLDEHYKPKLADFSFSLTIPFGETHVETSVAGTFGYLAPEHETTGIVSEKTDVHSYGVLLLELLSGKRPRVGILFYNNCLLLKFIRNESTEKEERLELILHNGLSMDVRQVEQAMAFMEVAVGCISRNPDERPAMKEVTQQLEQIERGELPLSSSLLRVQQLATVGSSEGVSQIRTQYESESESSVGVSPW